MMNEDNKSHENIMTYLSPASKERELAEVIHPGIQYFDPLYAALQGADVLKLKRYEASFAGFNVKWGDVSDEGDGYFTIPWIKEYTYPVTGRKVKVAGKSYLHLENGRVAGHSEAFSLHRWAKDAYGIAGWFLGSIFFFQRKMRREAAEKFREFAVNMHFDK